MDDLLTAFAADYGFALDDFQREAIAALTEGRSVLVAAPTGAGKTVVGEFAVWRALSGGGKCFYTTPIKALSNQKYNDLVATYGRDGVGLLTGDNVVNGEAPVVVMTTEVLRNMLYEDSPTLDGLAAVVLDEVHYLADRQRGAVWEEVIIQLAGDVQLACLSATVSNAEEFGAWLSQVRGEAGGQPETSACEVIISEHRPVPLDHHYFVGDRMFDTFRRGKAGGKRPTTGAEKAAQRASGGVPNPEVVMLERRAASAGRPSRSGKRQGGGVRLRTPRRSHVVKELARRRWLPAIYFLFSRNGCDQAVGQVVRDGVQLTSEDEQEEIRRIVDERTADLDGDDLKALGYGPWAAALERGIAAHHAGMVPVFKETVEELFVRGLVRVCFATETLALGINMPARTVVIERLEKWNGVRHELLSPGQFTQLTGRAGRRGLDDKGHAVVLYQRDVDFPRVASLVARRVEPLRSSFAPTYNMAVNLLRRYDRPEAERLLDRSFAQWQAAGRVSDDVDRLDRNDAALAGYRANVVSERGDAEEYWRLVREVERLESRDDDERRRSREEAVAAAVDALTEGDVVAMPGSGSPVLAAVISRTASRTGTPLAGAITEDRKLVRLGPREFDKPPAKLGWLPLPRDGAPRQADYRKRVALALRRMEVDASATASRVPETETDHEATLAELRARVRAHPVHDDPAREDIVRWARRADKLESDSGTVRRRVQRRTSSLVRQLQKIVGVLADRGYLTDSGHDPRPTEDGERLARIYADTDLLVAECLRRGVLDDLDGPTLAAVASAFVHETRAKDPPPVELPSAAVVRVLDAVWDYWAELADAEQAAGLDPTREPDPGFAAVIWRWAHGATLDDAIENEELTPGDFVRNVKQVADLLRQLRDAADEPLATACHRAQSSLVRGVVAYSTV